jgi:hypothetical protein
LVATTFQGEEAAGPLGIGGFFSYPPRSEKFPIIKRSGVAAFWNMSRLGKADGDFLGGRLAVCPLSRKAHVRGSYPVLAPFPLVGITRRDGDLPEV